MKNRAIFKYNNAALALLCSKCYVIIKTGKDFTQEEMNACCGMQGDASKYLPPQYCDNCK